MLWCGEISRLMKYPRRNKFGWKRERGMEKFSIENWARCYKHTSKIWNEICSHSNCSFACFSNAMSYSLNRIICVWKRFYMENNVENMQTLRWVFEKCRITEYERENWHCLTCSWHSLAFENPFVIGLLKLKELHFSSGNPIDFFFCVCVRVSWLVQNQTIRI